MSDEVCGVKVAEDEPCGDPGTGRGVTLTVVGENAQVSSPARIPLCDTHLLPVLVRFNPEVPEVEVREDAEGPFCVCPAPHNLMFRAPSDLAASQPRSGAFQAFADHWREAHR